MKKHLFFTLGFVSLSVVLFAQAPMLDSSNMSPYAGFVATTQEAKVIGVPDGSAGALQTWDYSSLQDSSALPLTIQYIDAGATPYSSDFIGANLCYREGNGYIEYQETTDSVYYNLGQVDSGQWYFYLSSPQVIWQYPLSYETIDTSTFGGSFYYEGYTDNETGTDTIIADGYGSLKLPGGIMFDSVLRVNSTKYYTDAYTGSVNAIYNTIINAVYYLTPGFQSPLLTIQHETRYLNNSFNASATLVNYALNVSLGINKLNVLAYNISVFPNPSTTQSIISLTLKGDANIDVYITNILGQKIKTINAAQIDAGLHNYEIETADMANGIYLITVEVNGSVAGVNKLVVE